MNINCDKRANDFYNHPSEQTRALIIPPTEMKVYFKSGGVINTGKLHNQIVRDCHGPRLRRYIEEKYYWDTQQFDAIN